MKKLHLLQSSRRSSLAFLASIVQLWRWRGWCNWSTTALQEQQAIGGVQGSALIGVSGGTLRSTCNLAGAWSVNTTVVGSNGGQTTVIMWMARCQPHLAADRAWLVKLAVRQRNNTISGNWPFGLPAVSCSSPPTNHRGLNG